jgi:hypothetical protein
MDTPEEFESQYFLPGKVAEIEVLTRLEQEGDEVTDTQKEVNIVVDEETIVQGHVDGIIGERVLEIKSMSDGEFKKFSATRWETPGLVQRYKWQISCYMVATGREVCVIVYNRDTGEIQRLGVEVPWYDLDAIVHRVLGIETLIGENKIPTTCDIPNYPCPYYYLHEEEEVEVEDALEDIGSIWMDLRKQEQKIKDQLEVARKDIIRLLGDRTRIRSESYKVNYSDVHTKRFNQDKARADGVEVDKYMDETVSKRLTVKREE